MNVRMDGKISYVIVTFFVGIRSHLTTLSKRNQKLILICHMCKHDYFDNLHVTRFSYFVNCQFTSLWVKSDY